MTRSLIIWMAAFLLLPESQAESEAFVFSRPIAEILGSTHVSGRYYFGDQDFLNEGADRLLELGMGGFKGWLTPRVPDAYPHNSNWPEGIDSLVALVRTPYFRELFDKPFNVYSFVVGEFNRVEWKRGVSPAQRKSIETEHYLLARYLLTRYRNTGKTFILQNWEGDNALRAWVIDDPAEYEVARQGMVDWLNARQDGIIRARRAVGMEGVRVVGAVEITRTPVGRQPFDHPLVIDDVVPHTYADLYAFSTWGTRLPGDERLLLDQLEYMASKAPPSELYGGQNLMMGEFGAYELTYTHPERNYPELHDKVTPGVFNDYSALGQLTANRKQLEYALQAGVRYAFYWELYCNGLREGLSLRDMRPDERGQMVATPDQLRGVWLIRPDGTKVPTYHYFRNMIKGGYIADRLTDWSRVHARSEHLQRPQGASFIGNQADVPGILWYAVKDTRFAALRMLHQISAKLDDVRMLVRDDSGEWQSVPTRAEPGPVLGDSGWRFSTLVSDVALPDNSGSDGFRVKLPAASAERLRLNKVIVESATVVDDKQRAFFRFAELDEIFVDRQPVDGFDPAVTEYQWRLEDDRVPVVEVLPADPRLQVKVEDAVNIPGTTRITVGFEGERHRTYQLHWVR